MECWFPELTRRKLQRGVHTSVGRLQSDTASFIDAPDAGPKPYSWPKSVDEILAVVKNSCHRVGAIYPAHSRYRLLVNVGASYAEIRLQRRGSDVKVLIARTNPSDYLRAQILRNAYRKAS